VSERNPLGQLSSDDLEDMTPVELGLELAAEVEGFLDSSWFITAIESTGIETTDLEVAYLLQLADEIQRRGPPK
jgi:hypothetical protein